MSASAKITPEVIEKVARLSRLAVSPEEAGRYADQLDKILHYADKLDNLDTSAVEPTSHAIPISNVFRADEPRKSLPPEEALANAPEQESQCFRVPQIIQG